MSVLSAQRDTAQPASLSFAEMPAGQRNRWLEWANSHDWGGCVPASFDDRTGEMVTSSYAWGDIHGPRYEMARHRTPADLRAWAGY